MPIYEYACTACHFQKDYLQKMSEPALTECPSCHQQTLYKKLSAPGFQLKGSGWYATDFKGKGSASETSQNKETKETETSSTPSTSDTTPSSTTQASNPGSCGTCA